MGFDLFFKSLKKYQPNFSTFFTNHVAGIIHRYWRDLFPEEYDDKSYITSTFNKESVLKAMEISDKQLYKLVKYCRKYNSNLFIASSMSQKARKDKTQQWDIYLDNFDRLLKFFELESSKYSLLPAMQPDYCIECENQYDLSNIKKKISQVRDVKNNEIIIETYNKNNSINISLKLTKSLYSEKALVIDQKKYKLEDIGLKLIKIDQGTAYHTQKEYLSNMEIFLKKIN